MLGAGVITKYSGYTKCIISGVTGGGGMLAECPLTFFTGKYLKKAARKKRKKGKWGGKEGKFEREEVEN